MALLFEYSEQYEKALQKWEVIRTKEGANRTVKILKQAGLKDWVKTYGHWVLQQDPEMFLTLFKREGQESKEDALDEFVGPSTRSKLIMNVDEVLEFLTKVKEE